jgi:hypothetical protein
VAWGQQKAKVPEVADKNERAVAERWPLFDGERMEVALESWRSDSMEVVRRKYVGGWSGKVVVVDQVGWEVMGSNFVLVLVLVFGDEGSLERDVAAVNKWAHGQDRD